MTGRYLGILIALFALIGVINGSNVAFAQEAVKVTAVGEKKYTEYSSYIEESAVEDAKRQAIKKVAASFPKSKKRMFKDLEESIYENIDDFVIESAVQQKKNDAGAKTFKVAISALVDVDALNAFFSLYSHVGLSQFFYFIIYLLQIMFRIITLYHTIIILLNRFFSLPQLASCTSSLISISRNRRLDM